MARSTTRRATILNCSTLTITLVVLIALYSQVKPVKRGYWCNDHTIQCPLKPATVGNYTLFVIAAVFPLISSHVIAQGFGQRFWTSKYWAGFGGKSFQFALGYMLVVITTGVAKFSVGRLRPNFMEYCVPRTSDNATSCPSEDYIVDYECTNPNIMVQRAHDYACSFFSGHAACSAYGMVFLVLTLQRTMKSSELIAFRVTLQVAALTVACYVGCTRVSDNFHHWDDVTVGLGVGAILAAMLDSAFQHDSTHIAASNGIARTSIQALRLDFRSGIE
ncbi:putative phosphatidate phosphatase [Halotydeus destructor]|nr:putative phosphatidate phosphatase [Halotydeus destructor]